MNDLELQVQAAYSLIATAPHEARYFPTGRRLAEDLGYPSAALAELPEEALDAFSGVGYLLQVAAPAAHEVVLDLGCGSGVDALLACKQAGHVIAVDMNPQMLARAHRALEQRGLTSSVTLIRARTQQLPLLDGSVQVAMVNGLFNLQGEQQRQELFRELARVVAPGGRVVAAEIVRSPLDRESPPTPADWFS